MGDGFFSDTRVTGHAFFRPLYWSLDCQEALCFGSKPVSESSGCWSKVADDCSKLFFASIGFLLFLPSALLFVFGIPIKGFFYMIGSCCKDEVVTVSHGIQNQAPPPVQQPQETPKSEPPKHAAALAAKLAQINGRGGKPPEKVPQNNPPQIQPAYKPPVRPPLRRIRPIRAALESQPVRLSGKQEREYSLLEKTLTLSEIGKKKQELKIDEIRRAQRGEHFDLSGPLLDGEAIREFMTPFRALEKGDIRDSYTNPLSGLVKDIIELEEAQAFAPVRAKIKELQIEELEGCQRAGNFKRASEILESPPLKEFMGSYAGLTLPKPHHIEDNYLALAYRILEAKESQSLKFISGDKTYTFDALAFSEKIRPLIDDLKDTEASYNFEVLKQILEQEENAATIQQLEDLIPIEAVMDQNIRGDNPLAKARYEIYRCKQLVCMIVPGSDFSQLGIEIQNSLKILSSQHEYISSCRGKREFDKALEMFEKTTIRRFEEGVSIDAVIKMEPKLRQQNTIAALRYAIYKERQFLSLLMQGICEERFIVGQRQTMAYDRVFTTDDGYDPTQRNEAGDLDRVLNRHQERHPGFLIETLANGDCLLISLAILMKAHGRDIELEREEGICWIDALRSQVIGWMRNNYENNADLRVEIVETYRENLKSIKSSSQRSADDRAFALREAAMPFENDADYLKYKNEAADSSRKLDILDRQDQFAVCQVYLDEAQNPAVFLGNETAFAFSALYGLPVELCFRNERNEIESNLSFKDGRLQYLDQAEEGQTGARENVFSENTLTIAYQGYHFDAWIPETVWEGFIG